MHAKSRMIRRCRNAALTLYIFGVLGCSDSRPGQELTRRFDEIVVCGRLFHTGTRVVLWTDPEGFDAYRVYRRFQDRDQITPIQPTAGTNTPNRYSPVREGLSEAVAARVNDHGWSLEDLQGVVDQFVIHYDACGTSRRCFEVLHDRRGLSVHFLLDIDGTIYQTLDVKERARHARGANDRSVGIEIAGIGAYRESSELSGWYRTGRNNDVRLTPPADWQPFSGPSDRVLRPSRGRLILGRVNGVNLYQYDFTNEQYAALARLTAALTRVLPKIRPDFPRRDNSVRPDTLPPDELRSYTGLLGHWHVDRDKYDPGPAFDWDRLIAEARRMAQR